MPERSPDPDRPPCPPVPEELPWPAEDRPLLAFLPLIYVAWADGELTRDEIERVRRKIDVGVPLDERSRERLTRWLDPDHPPPPKELNAMLRLVRRAGAELSEDERVDLAGLGRRLAEHSARAEDGDGELSAEVCQALGELEDALGIVGEEAARELLEAERPPRPEPEEPPRAFEPEALTAYLDGAHHELRQRLREVLSRPELEYPYGLPKEAYREQVLEWCRMLAREGFGSLAFPESSGGCGDLAQFIAVFETLAIHDTSLESLVGRQVSALSGGERHASAHYRDVGVSGSDVAAEDRGRSVAESRTRGQDQVPRQISGVLDEDLGESGSAEVGPVPVRRVHLGERFFQ